MSFIDEMIRRNRLGQVGPITSDIGGAYMPPPMQKQSMGMDTNDPENEQQLMAKLAAMFHPSHAGQAQLQNQVDNMPRRENYAPNFWRKMAAIGANLATARPSTYYGGAALGFDANIGEGLAAQKHVLEEPYDRAVSDWKTKLDPIERIATNENASNTNERMIAGNVLLAANRERQYDRAVKRDEVLKKTAEDKQELAETKAKDARDKEAGRLAVAQGRAATYDYKARNPKHDIEMDSKGRLIGIDPVTHRSTFILDTEGNPVMGSKMTEEDRINLQIKGRLQTIGATGANQQALEGTRETNREKLEDKKQPNRVALKGAGASKGDSANQTMIRQFSRAQEAVNSHPEWAGYIQLDRGGKRFNVGKPKGGDEATYQAAKNFIYGSTTNDTVQMKHPTSGKIGPVAQKDVEAAKKAGYVVVK